MGGSCYYAVRGLTGGLCGAPGSFLIPSPPRQVVIRVMFHTVPNSSWGDSVELHANVSW